MPTATLTEQRIFDVKDAAGYLQEIGGKGTTVYFVRTLINSGQLPSTRIGRKFFVTRTALDNWLNQSEKKRRV